MTWTARRAAGRSRSDDPDRLRAGAAVTGFLIQQLVNALTIGAIYALIALGYTMVYGVLRLINFAHSEMFMVGGHVAFFLLAASREPCGEGAAILLVFAMFVVTFVARRPARRRHRGDRLSPAAAAPRGWRRC